MKTKTTVSAREILRRRLYEGNPGRIEARNQTHREMALGDKIRRYREIAGFTQEELARKIGSSPSAISRVEDADYDGHSMNVLHRIADALEMRLLVDFEPRTNSRLKQM